MFARKITDTASRSPTRIRISGRIRIPSIVKALLLGLPLVLAQCNLSDDKEMAGSSETGDRKEAGSSLGDGDPTIPGQGGDSLKVPQAGQLTAGEIDDHLNYPQFKAYVQRTLQAAKQPNLEFLLPDAADVKDRFAGNTTRPKALDLAFAIDATGSMGDEMNYLAVEFQTIVGRIQSRHSELSIRYGLVFYRDHGDEYVVQKHPFQTSASETQAILKSHRADGGGDTPEAMDEGLDAAVGLGWRGAATASQLLFLVADAPPHDAKIAPFLKAVGKAATKGIRVYPLAASSTDELTELLMRIAAFQTSGSYSFLTNDSRIGNDHKEPSIPCYLVTRLDELLTRIIESEITGTRIEPDSAAVIRTSGNYDKGRCKEAQVAAR
jgi:von Willebrand factor type A domain